MQSNLMHNVAEALKTRATASGSAWKWPIWAALILLRRWCQIERVKSKVVPNESGKPARSSSVAPKHHVSTRSRRDLG